jgi:chemotaxis methyl-accepting protein methylase/chemotaxis signal transduction protein
MEPRDPPIFPKELIERFAAFLSTHLGLHFHAENRQGLERKLASLASTLELSDPIKGLEWMLQPPVTPEKMALLTQYFTIGETYFFRDRALFKALEKGILPDRIAAAEQKGEPLRIWSTACCTGEEPYSLAILLHQLLPNSKNWTVFATDINGRFLEHAKRAVYSQWSFRVTISPQMQEQYFIPTAGGFELISTIRERVQFFEFNLVSHEGAFKEHLVEGFDLLLCNNVLIYFSSQQIGKTVHRLISSLKEGGWFCAAAIELPFIADARLEPTLVEGVTLFKRKQSSPLRLETAVQGHKVIQDLLPHVPLDKVYEEEVVIVESSSLPPQMPQESRRDTASILKSRAERFAKKIEIVSEEGNVPMVEFTLAHEHYAIDALSIREIYPIEGFTPLPGVPAFVLGLMNVRRKVLALIDLRVLFELFCEGEILGKKAIILQKDSRAFAIVADRVIGVRSFSLNHLHSALTMVTGARQQFIKGVTPEGVILLDAEKLLFSKEILVDNLSEVMHGQ